MCWTGGGQGRPSVIESIFSIVVPTRCTPPLIENIYIGKVHLPPFYVSPMTLCHTVYVSISMLVHGCVMKKCQAVKPQWQRKNNLSGWLDFLFITWKSPTFYRFHPSCGACRGRLCARGGVHPVTGRQLIAPENQFSQFPSQPHPLCRFSPENQCCLCLNLCSVWVSIFQMHFTQIMIFLFRVLLWRCKLGVLQYTVVRPVTTIIAL